MERYNRWILKFLSLPRSAKRLVMVLVDIVALVVALWSAFALRLSEWWPQSYLEEAWSLFLVTPLVGVAIFVKLGMYRAVVRYMNVRLLQAVAVGVFLLVLSLYVAAITFDIWRVPRSVPLIFGLAAWLYLGGTRIIYRSYYHWLTAVAANDKTALIYGAGSAGAQLALALQASGEARPIGFIDDDPKLQKSTVCGLRVYPVDALDSLISKRGVNTVLLAMLNITPARRAAVLDMLSRLNVEVKTMPTLREQLAGEAIDQLRSVEIEDLLGREAVPPQANLIERSVSGKAVCITGAGGSIGSELARQALAGGAQTLVLYEQSEFALYSIESELSRIVSSKALDCQIVPILGSVLDADRLDRVLRHYSVKTLYHAAAYKHVPLVEHNVLQGVLNNVAGTRTAALAAKNCGLERFVLISTDKAVRPTNVMGATKRFAEMVVQCLAKLDNSDTIFSMVRFGNVLGSSGSVVPVFRQQIATGGPVTVTHPEINRFFMTIPEAASLVIQAGSMAKGGDVFLLDMGEPVKIAELARQMIKLSGKTLRDEAHPDGDIEIAYTGLRPGEKLYEELLIGNNPAGTQHPKIMTADEECVTEQDLITAFEDIQRAAASNDSDLAREVLMRIVADFNPSSENVDLTRASKTDSPAGPNVVKFK